MFSSAEFALKWCWSLFGLAPMNVPQEFITPEEASLIFSGPKFFVALLAGVVMAFAFQLLLTNFSVAVGIASLGNNSGDDDSSESLGGTIRKVETAAGLWALITATIALFSACFLAVKLSLIESTLLGAIIGVVIWSTYFSVLVWVGSSAVGSLIGSVVNTATSGFQGLMGTATAAMGANAAKNQIERDFAKVLEDPEAGFENLSDRFKEFDRDTLVQLLQQRQDISQEEANNIVSQLEATRDNILNRAKQLQEQATAKASELRYGKK